MRYESYKGEKSISKNTSKNIPITHTKINNSNYDIIKNNIINYNDNYDNIKNNNINYNDNYYNFYLYNNNYNKNESINDRVKKYLLAQAYVHEN